MHYIVLKIYHTKNKKIFIDIEINTSNSPVFVSYYFIKVITDPITPKKPAIIINIYSTGNLFASNIAVIKLSETMYSNLIIGAIFCVNSLLNSSIRYPIINAGSKIKIAIIYLWKINTLSKLILEISNTIVKKS